MTGIYSFLSHHKPKSGEENSTPRVRPGLSTKAKSEAVLSRRMMPRLHHPSSPTQTSSRHSGVLLGIQEETGATESPSSSHHEIPSGMTDSLNNSFNNNNNNSDNSMSNTIHLRPVFSKAHSVANVRRLSSATTAKSLFTVDCMDRTFATAPDKPVASASTPPITTNGNIKTVQNSVYESSSGMTIKNHRRKLQQMRSSRAVSSTAAGINKYSTPEVATTTGPDGGNVNCQKSNLPQRPMLASHRASSEAILETMQRQNSRQFNRDGSKRGCDGHSSLSLLHLERNTFSTNKELAEFSPSNTFHFRPDLELALEKRQSEDAHKRAMHQSLTALQQSLSTLGMSGTIGDAAAASGDYESDLPFEFEPDEEELERRKKTAVGEELLDDYVEMDPLETACQVARQQYQRDFEHSRIVDLTHKFPHFDLSEVVQGVFLGKGSFAQVIEVKGFCLKPWKEDEPNDNSNTSKSDHWNISESQIFKRRAMAGLDDDDDFNDDASLEYEPLKGGSGGEEEDKANGSLLNKPRDQNQTQDHDEDNRSLDRAGYQDITDDDLDLGDLEEQVDKLLEHSDDAGLDQSLVMKKLSNRSLFQESHKTKMTSNKSMDSSRRFIASHCHRAKDGEPHKYVARYALKQLKRAMTKDPHTLLQGVADMATESRVLSSLTDHPNLIKLRGIAHGPDMPFHKDYFILLDRLYDTLESRIRKWKLLDQKLSGIKRLFRDKKRIQKKQLWMDRISFAYDLSSALAYLHSKHVIHRDLKPDNIGFDIRGDIKIFDFGLAKELPTINNGSRNVFHLTAMCGSPRYMAPEVGMEEPYNELCDVYSFGVLLWEMMALNKPYDKIDMVGLISDVWKDGPDAKRPCPSLVEKGNFLTAQGFWSCGGRRRRLRSMSKETRGSPASLQALLESCWSYTLEERPSMSAVENQLREELMAFRKGHSGVEDRRMSHQRRRSPFVFDEEDDEEPSSHQYHHLYNALKLFRTNPHTSNHETKEHSGSTKEDTLGRTLGGL